MKSVFTVVVFGLTLAVSAHAAVLHVDADATGGNNGSSWTNAYTSLQSALAAAQSGDEIWIAEGLHTPSASDTSVGFVLPSGVSIYGGFSGDEVSLTAADPVEHRTILSGDLAGDDTTDAIAVTLAHGDIAGSNTQTTLLQVAGGGSTVSGLTLCGADNEGSTNDDFGGGARILGTATMKNCVIRGNRAWRGGGLYAQSESEIAVTVQDCDILQNSVTNNGGGLFFGDAITPRVTRCRVMGNSAAITAGIRLQSIDYTSRVYDTLVAGNFSSGNTGAISVHVPSTSAVALLINLTVVGNRSGSSGQYVGGLDVYDNSSSVTTVVVRNSIFYGNSQGSYRTDAGSPWVLWDNSIIAGSGGSGAGWNSDYGQDDGANLDADPRLFSSAIQSEAPTIAGDYRIGGGSPGIDAGDNIANTNTTDLEGNPRKLGTIDIGAYEAGKSWRGTSSNLWATAANWTTNAAPAASEEIWLTPLSNSRYAIDLGSSARSVGTLNIFSDTSYTLTGTGGLTVGVLDVHGANSHSITTPLTVTGSVAVEDGRTLALSEFQLKSDSSSVDLSVEIGSHIAQTGGAFNIGGGPAPVTMRLQPGSQWSVTDSTEPEARFQIGMDGEAEVVVDNATLRFDTDGGSYANELAIGAGSNGRLELKNGAVVDEVSGTFSLSIGEGGYGELIIDHSSMDTLDDVVLENGSLIVEGSTLSTNKFRQKDAGSSFLAEDAHVTSNTTTVSGGSYHLINTTGSSSVRTFGGLVAVSVRIEGGTLSGSSLSIGDLYSVAAADVTMLLDDAAALSSSTLRIGNGNRTFLTLAGASSLTSSNQVTIGRVTAGYESELEITEGSLLSARSLSVMGGATLTVTGTGSELQTTHGDFVFADTWGGNTLEVVEGGEVSVATAFTMSSGDTLRRSVGDDSSLTCATANLAGTLVVELASGYTPMGGDTFTLFSASTVNGDFTNLVLPDLSAQNLAWLPSIQGGNYVLTLVVEFAYLDDPDAHVSLGRLIVQSGESIVIDTDAGTITGSHNFTSTELNTDVTGGQFRVFNFDYVEIASGSSVSVVGEKHLALLSRSHFKLGAPISMPGANGADGFDDGFGDNNTAGEAGGDGGRLALIAEGRLEITANISLPGGAGGHAGGGNTGRPGGRGGQGGVATIAASELLISASTNVKGGTGGDGSFNPASGRQGGAGAGGNGGNIYVFHTGTSSIPHNKSGGLAGIGSNPGINGAAGFIYYRNSLDDLEIQALAAFRLQYGLATNGSDDTTDWSQNGVPNLHYAAFGLGNPTNTDIDRTRLPAIDAGTVADTITFTFVRPTANDTGLEILVKTSADLGNWFTPDDLGLDYLPVSETVEDLGDDYERVTQTYTVILGETDRFYRVEAGELSGLD